MGQVVGKVIEQFNPGFEPIAAGEMTAFAAQLGVSTVLGGDAFFANHKTETRASEAPAEAPRP